MDELLRPVVRCFLEDSIKGKEKPKFSDLRSHVAERFNIVHGQMFKDWVHRNYPTSFNFSE